MIERILSLIAPHYCIACRREGSLLCANCHDELLDSSNPACLQCHQPTFVEYLCSSCRSHSPIDAAWIAGQYESTLKDLLHVYKFERAREACLPLTALINEAIPQIPEATWVIHIPTTPRRIRQRGYDQAALLAKQFARTRGMTHVSLLRRTNNTRQLGANRSLRLKQAENMFAVTKSIPNNTTVLLIDDVITTGATVTAAAKVLKEAGAEHVFVTACAHDKLQK